MIVLSASQIKTYRECKRKWAFQSIAKIRTPSTEAQELGKEVDDNMLQPYLSLGREFDRETQAGRIAATALSYLPQPKYPGLEVQKHLTLRSPTLPDVGYQGYIDLWLPSGGMSHVIGADRPVLCDFKTTSNIGSWALSRKDLKEDVQAQLYATWAILTLNVQSIDLVWVYMQTKGEERAELRHVVVTTEEVADQFRKIEETATQMAVIRREANKVVPPEGGYGFLSAAKDFARSLPPTPSACSNYGGCPFRSDCNLGPQDYINGERNNIVSTTSLLAGLKERRARGLGINPPLSEAAAAAAATAAVSTAETVAVPEIAAIPVVDSSAVTVTEPVVETVAEPAVTPAPETEVAPAVKRGRPRRQPTNEIPPPPLAAPVVEASAPLPPPAPVPAVARDNDDDAYALALGRAILEVAKLLTQRAAR